MRYRKNKIRLLKLFVIMLLFGWSVWLCSFSCPVSAGEASFSDGAALSEEVMEQALQIIESSADGILDDQTLEQLSLLGLTKAQIEMLESLVSAEHDSKTPVTESSSIWKSKQPSWIERPSGLWFVSGIFMAVVVIIIIIIVRKSVFDKHNKKER